MLQPLKGFVGASWIQSSAKIGVGLLLVIGIGMAHTADAMAICNPGRPPGRIGSTYQGGDQWAPNLRIAGVNIQYYTPYVQQGDGSDSAAWQAMGSTQCSTQGSYPIYQTGFAQQVGDGADHVFYEVIDCSVAEAPIELPQYTASSARFNVTAVPFSTGFIATAYYGSTVIDSEPINWTPSLIAIAFEVHDQNDQGYGGYNAPSAFTDPEWADQGGIGHMDALGLTPNDYATNNQTTAPYLNSLSWLAMRLIPPYSFGLYDTACPN